MPDAEEGLFTFLDELGITYRTVGHAPVATVEEAKKHRVEHEGAHVKNLFVRNKKGRMFLVTVLEDRIVDLKDLAKRLDAGHLSFGSPARLLEHLGVKPGAVTPLAALHDKSGAVTVVLDAAIARERFVHCHPLRNDRTTTLHAVDLPRFLMATGHMPVEIELDTEAETKAKTKAKTKAEDEGS